MKLKNYFTYNHLFIKKINEQFQLVKRENQLSLRFVNIEKLKKEKHLIKNSKLFFSFQFNLYIQLMFFPTPSIYYTQIYDKKY